MADHATPNRPAHDLARASAVPAASGVAEEARDGRRMILRRGSLALEFLPDPTLDPVGDDRSSCLRLDDVDTLHAQAVAACLSEATRGQPRLQASRAGSWGGRVGAPTDPDGGLFPPIRARAGA